MRHSREDASIGRALRTLTRREFFVLWPFSLFVRDREKIAGVPFRVERRGRSARRYFWVHGNEVTARDVLREHLRAARGKALLTTSPQRWVEVEGGRLDPNRMFSRVGAAASLRRLNPQWTAPQVTAACDRLDRDRERFLRALLPPARGLLVALHNNSEGYSVKDEVAASDRTALTDAARPHEFMLCTDPADFDRLARSPYNVVLQQHGPQDDDGSLSRLAAKRNVRYVNIEAGLGQAERQREMLAWVEANLP